MNLDLEAEKRLSVSLVLDPTAWDYVSWLKPEMLASEMGRAVVEGVRAVVQAAKPITPVTVQAAMVAAGRGSSVVPNWAKGERAPPAEVVELARRVERLWRGRTGATGFAEVATLAQSDPDAAERMASNVLADMQAGREGGAKRIGALVYDWMSELQAEAANPDAAPVFFETGFAKLDAATGGIARGELSVLAARPGQGKSSFIVALATNLALSGVPVGMFWLEDDWRDAVRRFLSRRLRCESWRLRGKPGLAANYVASHVGLLDKADLPLFVDDSHGLTIVDIQARMRRMSREHGVKVFILDHLGEVRIEREERWGDRHDLALGRVAREYRDTAKSLGAVPILVSQMNRRWEQRGADSIPQMSDLDGSGQVEQAARLIAFVQMYRGEDGTPTGGGALHVVKATGGQPGSLPLRWNSMSMTWEEAS